MRTSRLVHVITAALVGGTGCRPAPAPASLGDAVSEAARARSEPTAPPLEPPEGLAFVVSVGRPARDVALVAALMPQYQGAIEQGLQRAAAIAGPELGSAFDLEQTVHLGFGLEPHEYMGAAVFLRADFA